MDERRITQLLLSDPRIKLVFGGLYASDRFPAMEDGKLYLINTAKYLDPIGEHYVIVERGLISPKMVSWACSYASNPQKYPLIYAKLKETGCQISKLRKPLQKLKNDKLTNCSSYSLFFAYHLARGIGIRQMERTYFDHVNLYKLNIFIVVVIRALFKVKTSIGSLLYDRKFVESLKKKEINGRK